MLGLQRLTAASASLLLNLEAVFTALIAWLIFKEHVQRHLVLGMGLIVAGGGLLAWQPDALTTVDPVGISCIAGACLGWAIDNNLTRRIAAHDAVFIAMLKGLCAGIVNTGLALLLGATLPSWHSSLLVMGIGLLGYGVSLIWFVLALRNLGTARTGAYFSLAPFIGAAAAILWLHEPASWPFWIAASLMGVGVWLHLREAHDHQHTHEPLVHNHRHVHDAHHQHGHDFAWDGREPHTHPHRHEPLTHSHPHYPDIHHRHSH
jgi:drug/metabolite transporter (DMT)-like permease